jgi:hypothetical protein
MMLWRGAPEWAIVGAYMLGAAVIAWVAHVVMSGGKGGNKWKDDEP